MSNIYVQNLRNKHNAKIKFQIGYGLGNNLKQLSKCL